MNKLFFTLFILGSTYAYADDTDMHLDNPPVCIEEPIPVSPSNLPSREINSYGYVAGGRTMLTSDTGLYTIEIGYRNLHPVIGPFGFDAKVRASTSGIEKTITSAAGGIYIPIASNTYLGGGYHVGTVHEVGTTFNFFTSYEENHLHGPELHILFHDLITKKTFLDLSVQRNFCKDEVTHSLSITHGWIF